MLLDFEQPVIELEEKINGLKALPSAKQLNIQDEIERLEKRCSSLLCDIYKKLTPWQKVMVARHPDRPHTSHYIKKLTSSFVPLCGDRAFGEDAAIIGGLARFRSMNVMIIGHEKGSDTEDRIARNFGMAHPEGYRKVTRLLDIANRFGLPVIMFVDTAGAYAGTGAEERGQFEAIARCLEKSLDIDVPIVSVIIGEGGSGGAVAMATANHVMMLSYSVYSVISPEGCASILWRTADKKSEAADVLKLTSDDLLGYGIIDQVIKEPVGGAHRNKIAVISAVGDAVYQKISDMAGKKSLKEARRERFLSIGKKIAL